ncbi:MAG: hoxU [Gammaproteobacteria bacterium]|nr:MAG: hoxU [Gammaproteobacteria bacterium]TND02132.1 MAG: hoxU [Gammaproteobacteria bacterium]
MTASPYLPLEARIADRHQESDTVFTLDLELTDAIARAAYRFEPGQFNMVYLYGVGEVAISIVSDPDDEHALGHTIRRVGRVTNGIAKLRKGDCLGIRGPYGRGWPVEEAQGRDVVLITGGLGCAPVVGVINYIVRRRDLFGHVTIIQGVKHSADLIWRGRYEQWATLPDTQVLLAADVAGPGWPWHQGRVTALLDQATLNPANTIVMMCGPEIMMRLTIDILLQRGIREQDIWLSMERNMQCAVGHCGHCQYGPQFVCKDGPVFCYPEVKALFGVSGF